MRGEPTGPRVRLHVDADELAACVACGLCLPHCPTYRVTGEEAASPRGRIAAMRAVQAGAPADDAFVHFMETCVQCRGCEAACPSGVPFGRLMEGTRAALAQAGRTAPRWQRPGYGLLGRPRALRAGSAALAVVQRLGLVPRRVALPRLPLRRPALRARATTGERVWLHTGCVMDAWLRPVHQAALDVVEAAGGRVALPGPAAACCGALHAHAGLDRAARRLARRTMAAFPGEAPVLVDSAGCGAQLRAYGELLGTDEARAFSARVLDVHEWLAPRVGRLGLRASGPPVAVQDPCHLRHVQRAHGAVRTVLGAAVPFVELDDEGLCCGAGGAFAALQPEMASAVRARKLEAIGRSGAPRVASANPGCMLHLRAAGVDARHPLELVAEALRGG